jgi:hypothetical protein
MKQLAERPPILTLHALDSGYLVRLNDLSHRPLLVGLSKMLGGAGQLVVVTPNDIKVFAAAEAIDAADAESSIPAVPPPPEADDSPGATAVPESASPPPDEHGRQVVGETAQGTKVVRRRKSPAPTAGHPESCQRCAGSGRIQLLTEGGVGAETACHICSGRGTIQRYGARR